MMEGGKFGSNDEDAAPNFALSTWLGGERRRKKVLHHFRYEVTVYAIEIQGVSFILFVSKEALSHMNPAFVMMSLDRRHVWDVVNIVYSWHYCSWKGGQMLHFS